MKVMLLMMFDAIVRQTLSSIFRSHFPLALLMRPLHRMLEPQGTEARQQEQSQDYLVH